MFFLFIESILLATSISTDAFTAALSYGFSNIKIPRKSLIVISLICSLMLCISMILGRFVSSFIPKNFTVYASFTVLFLIGITRLFDLLLKKYISCKSRLNLKFSLFSLNFILTVYADAKLADIDGSHSLSLKEAFALAVALSLDSLAVGFASGTSSILISLGFSFILTASSLYFGGLLGKKLNGKLKFDLSYISALLLIVLSLTKLYV